MQSATQNANFKALVAANRSAGRLAEPAAPKAKPATMLPTGMRLWPDEIAQAKQLADADERSLAWFCRRMYLRGLESFLADGGDATASK